MLHPLRSSFQQSTPIGVYKNVNFAAPQGNIR
jgi:hypothetical protein